MANQRPDNLDAQTPESSQGTDSDATRRHIRPPPVPAKPTPVPAAGGGTQFRRVALVSCLMALAGIMALVVSWIILVARGRASGICAVLSIALFVTGVIVALVALCGIGRYGKRGILWPALIGTFLNIPLLIFSLMHGLFTVVYNAGLPPPAHLSPAAHSPSAHQLRDEQLQFTMDIPEGFDNWPEAKADPAVAHGLIRRSPDRETACVITIEPLNTVLSRAQRLRATQIPSNLRGRITQRKWRGVDIDVVDAVSKSDGVTTYIYECMVPLRPKAVRVNVAESGPQSDPEALSRLVDKILATLDGQTTW